MVRILAVTFSPVVPSPRVARRHQPPVLVAQRHGKPVDLRLGGEGDRIVRQAAEEAIDAATKSRTSSSRERVVERQHRPRMADRRESRRRRGADPARRAVVADEIRKARLDRGVAALQRVIIGIGNLRRVLP